MLVTLHDLTKLRQVETSRREFVSNVSHELRTPRSSIKAMAETLEDGGLADARINSDYIRRIHVETDRMTTLVNDLLDLTRLQSGQDNMETHPVDIAAVIQEEGRRYSDIARSLGIETRVSLPGGRRHPGGRADNAVTRDEPHDAGISRTRSDQEIPRSARRRKNVRSAAPSSNSPPTNASPATAEHASPGCWRGGRQSAEQTSPARTTTPATSSC